mmetsp:Transcript_50294/g.108334  ORF Transcript_50294/g.108334 Transcript_50294/m.108334 type:complete len:212 (-) Transcript_50294:54-689(-)
MPPFLGLMCTMVPGTMENLSIGRRMVACRCPSTTGTPETDLPSLGGGSDPKWVPTLFGAIIRPPPSQKNFSPQRRSGRFHTTGKWTLTLQSHPPLLPPRLQRSPMWLPRSSAAVPVSRQGQRSRSRTKKRNECAFSRSTTTSMRTTRPRPSSVEGLAHQLSESQGWSCGGSMRRNVALFGTRFARRQYLAKSGRNDGRSQQRPQHLILQQI